MSLSAAACLRMPSWSSERQRCFVPRGSRCSSLGRCRPATAASRSGSSRSLWERREMCLAVPGRLVDTYVEHGVKMGCVDFGGVRRAVCLEHVATAAVGDYLLVHVGFALTRLDEAEA